MRTQCGGTGVEFGFQRVGAAADGGQRIGFARFQLDSEGLVLLLEQSETIVGEALDLVAPVAQFLQRRQHLAVQGCDLFFARIAELAEPIKPADELFELALRHLTGIADLAGHVACRIGDDGQLIAQPVHVSERAFADRPDAVHLRAVVGDESLQPVRIGAQPVAGDAAEAFEIARLRGDEFARQAQFAVDGGETRFERLRFQR